MRSPSRRALLTTASVAVSLAAADTYVVVLALTDMMAGVGIGIDALQRATPIISGFLLGYVAVLPLIGRIADLVDRQKVLLACLIVFILGSAITALAIDLGVLVAGRVIQGVGGGGLVPATLAIVAELWEVRRRGLPLGVVGAVQELGSVAGPLLGAAVLVIADWRMIFWLNAILGVLLAIAVIITGGVRLGRPKVLPAILVTLTLGVAALTLIAPEGLVTSVEWGGPFVPFGTSTSVVMTPIGLTAGILLLLTLAVTARSWLPLLRRADVLGALLLGGSLGCIILTFAAADPEREVVGPLGYTLLPVAAVLAVLYLVRHRMAREPLVPRGTTRGRAAWALLCSVFVGVALVAIIVNIPVLAHLTYTDSQVTAALVLLRFLIAVPVGALLGGWVLRWISDGIVTVVGLAGCAVALALMAGWGDGSLASSASYVVLALAGLGLGLAVAPVNNAALADTRPETHGTISALIVVARMVGMVVGLALLTAIGLHDYYQAVEALPDQTDGQALLDAGVVQVQSVFRGAAWAAGAGALLSLGLGLTREHEKAAVRRQLG